MKNKILIFLEPKIGGNRAAAKATNSSWGQKIVQNEIRSGRNPGEFLRKERFMKRVLPFLLLALAIMLACGKSIDKLSADSETFRLATTLAEKIPMLNPEKNATLVKAKSFSLSAGSLFKELETNMGKNISQLTDADTTELSSFLHRVLNSMVESRVLLNAAQTEGVAVDSTQVDSVVQTFFRNNGGEERFMQILEANGLTLDILKEDITENLIKENFLNDNVFANMQITPDDLQNAYNEDKTTTVRHILLMTQGKSPEEKETIHSQMENLLAQAKAGENFSDLAKKYTEDPGSKENGGLYEDIQRGQMVKEFEDAAFSVPIGQISDIIETSYGYHILKIEGRKKESRPFDEVKAALERQLQNRMRQSLYTQTIDSLKAAEKVEILFN